MIQENKELITQLINSQSKFWTSWAFWISSILGIVGIFISAGAWIAANNAKQVATKAKISISIHEIETALIVVKSKLQDIRTDVSYNEIRTICLDLVAELDRIKSIFEVGHILDETTFNSLTDLGNNIINNLKNVKPDSTEKPASKTFIFDGMEETINDSIRFLSCVIGKIQAENIEGDNNE